MVFMDGKLRLAVHRGFLNPDRLAELFVGRPERASGPAPLFIDAEIDTSSAASGAGDELP
jgi:hypothetical protein